MTAFNADGKGSKVDPMIMEMARLLAKRGALSEEAMAVIEACADGRVPALTGTEAKQKREAMGYSEAAYAEEIIVTEDEVHQAEQCGDDAIPSSDYREAVFLHWAVHWSIMGRRNAKQ